MQGLQCKVPFSLEMTYVTLFELRHCTIFEIVLACHDAPEQRIGIERALRVNSVDGAYRLHDRRTEVHPALRGSGIGKEIIWIERQWLQGLSSHPDTAIHLAAGRFDVSEKPYGRFVWGQCGFAIEPRDLPWVNACYRSWIASNTDRWHRQGEAQGAQALVTEIAQTVVTEPWQPVLSVSMPSFDWCDHVGHDCAKPNDPAYVFWHEMERFWTRTTDPWDCEWNASHYVNHPLIGPYKNWATLHHPENCPHGAASCAATP